MRLLCVCVMVLFAHVASAADMTISWDHDGSGAIDLSTGRTIAPLNRFNIYQSAMDTGPYRLTNTVDGDIRQQVVTMAYEPTSWVKITAVAANDTESFPSAPVSKTVAGPVLPPPPPLPASYTLTLALVGKAESGQPWAVQATTDAPAGSVLEWYINGHSVLNEYGAPWCLYGDDGTTCLLKAVPDGPYTIEAKLYVNAQVVTTKALTVQVQAPVVVPPAPTNNLTVRALDANRVEITGKTGACRSLKTTGTGLKRIVTCVP